MKTLKLLLASTVLLSVAAFTSCTQKEKGCTDPVATNYNADAEEDDGSCTYAPAGPQLVFKFKFDPNQERYDSFGNISTVPAGNAAQSPTFNNMSGHYVEMIPTAWTALGSGEVLYDGPKTTEGGAEAIDFDQAILAGQNEVFLSIPLSSVNAGTYEYIRVSVSYQNFDILYNFQGINQAVGTVASFIGYNTYISSYDINSKNVSVNSNKLQGYWGFETTVFGQSYFLDGQAQPGATTVVNPLPNSPIPPGSCLVTGAFETPLTLTGNETEDVTVVLSFSTNNSFEWHDEDGNGQYDTDNGDYPVDMGLRGLKAIVQ